MFHYKTNAISQIFQEETLMRKFVCRKFIRKCSQDPQSEGKGRTRMERGVGYNSYNKASASPKGALELGWPFRLSWVWAGPSVSSPFHELWKVGWPKKR